MKAARQVADRLSPRTRSRVAKARVGARTPTASLRLLPSFLVIGAQRAGSSSLYKYLQGHPTAAASLRKETEYFTRFYGRGPRWYRAHFPLGAPWASDRVAFEADPTYLFYPPAPGRIATDLPDARFVVLLRDPVERAFSQYRHMVRLGFETLGFEQAVLAEEDRIRADRDALARDPLHYCTDYLRFGYLARSRYGEQFARWFEVFDRDRFLVVRSEDLFQEPRSTFERILGFVGLPAWEPPAFRNHSYRASPLPEPDIPERARRWLEDHLEEDRAILARLPVVVAHP